MNANTICIRGCGSWKYGLQYILLRRKYDMESKILNIPCIYKAGGRMGVNGWGTLYNEDTDEELGYAFHCMTRIHPDSFSINRKDFSYASRPGSLCKYVFFENIAGNKKLVMFIQDVIELVEKATLLQPDSEYVVLSWNDILGIPNRVNVPVEQPQSRKIPF
jgi:hypothetical protein